ncbi:MAG: HNH endonuclease, partial [SAR202 cluster bacterium]|nr:HNH endonuclease [SAR202 cluster bacterium]
MLLEKIKKIKVWRKGDLRAPHKPLLILFAISRINNRHIPYVDMDTHLKELLDSFGPSTDNQRPQYPFWRLQNDSIWEILNCEKVSISSSGDVSAGDLIRFSAAGGFKQKYYDELINSSDSRNEIINYLLNTNFPDSYHQAILDRLALSTDFTFKKDSRDPKFRDKILKAYEYKCCICEMQITLNQKDTILDAAHIKWHQYNGPSKESNGLCLCVIHHRLYDRGV